MNASVTALALDIPLRRPYALSFGTITSLNTLCIAFQAQGRTGWGEITPLPGYSEETPESVTASVRAFFRDLDQGGDYRAMAQALWDRAPFAASGLLCAQETWRLGGEDHFRTPLSAPVPLAALCQGTTPEECEANARDLLQAGFSTLKMKVGIYTTSHDTARVKAAARVLPEQGKIRLDANQAMDYASALEFCMELEAVSGVHFLEQPFAPSQWEWTQQLVAKTSLPIMLDEAIWSEDHVRRAADCGVRIIKAKLAKHKGIEGSRAVISLARSLGMDVVFGNGVQTGLGNHLELMLHHELGISLASEANGFAKHDFPPCRGLSAAQGYAHGHGLAAINTLFDHATVISKAQGILTEPIQGA